MKALARDTSRLFDHFYYANPNFVDGTTEFHTTVKNNSSPGSSILEVGAGPSNTTSSYLASIGRVCGLDVSEEVKANAALSESFVYDGTKFPFSNRKFDLCVSNYVLEHVPNPIEHFNEVSRVLKPDGKFIFRTPNLCHYVTFMSWLLPTRAHLALANRLRGLGSSAHDPYPTLYRANTAGVLRRLGKSTGMPVQELRFIEKEPSYGRVHPLFFYPMMAYERFVNSAPYFAPIRINILGVLKKAASK
jgi:SAM-dependent methyltransferase